MSWSDTFGLTILKRLLATENSRFTKKKIIHQKFPTGIRSLETTSMCINRTAFQDTFDWLVQTDDVFSIVKNQHSTICELRDSGQPADITSAAARFRRQLQNH